VQVTLAVWTANAVGAIVVFAFANWVVPTPELPNAGTVRLVNLAALGAYLLVALPVGALWGARRLRPIVRWLGEDREPDESERRETLRAPLRTPASTPPCGCSRPLSSRR